MLPEHYLELTGLAFNGDKIRGQKDIDVFVKQTFAQAILRACIPIDEGKHFTHAATIGGKLVIKLTQNASQMGSAVNQGDPIAEFRQIQRGPDAAYSSPYNQRFTDFSVHESSNAGLMAS
jgi:hypothetical protein